MKLRTRVTLAVATVTVVTLAIASSATLVLVQRDELADLDRALLAQARLAARLAAIGDPERPVLESGPAEVPEHYEPSVPYVALYDASGRLLAATESFHGSPPAFPFFHIRSKSMRDSASVDFEIDGQPLRGSVVPCRGGFLLYAASRSEVDSDVAFLARVFLILLGAAALVTSLVARWLGRRLSSDVQEIARVARDVAGGNLHARAGDGIVGSAETAALASDLDHMIEQLGQLVVAQRTFVSHAAHELRSPLSTLRGELQLALRRPRSVAEHEQTIAQALGDVDALVLLAENLLTLARAESTGEAEPDALVSDIVDDALRAAKGGADLRGVRLMEKDYGVNTADVRVRGTRRDLSRALRNLVDNAVLHSAPSQVVEVVLSKTETHVALAVEDDGPGVPEHDRPHVFKPFFRGARDRGDIDAGAGLGLAIAAQIVRRSGGELLLDDSFERGARFVIRLRVRAASDS